MADFRTFIAYSHDSPEHKAWVLELATRLRSDGIDADLDQWGLELGDQVPLYMEQSVRESDFVVIVCTPDYKERADNRTGGVGYEGGIMTAEVFYQSNHRKFITILRDGDWQTATPTWCEGKYGADLRGDRYNEQEYQKLKNTLLGIKAKPPKVGASPAKAIPMIAPERSSLSRAYVAKLKKVGSKEQILKSAEFIWNPRRGLWFSHSERKVFSDEVIRDHDVNWLQGKLHEVVPTDQFYFYFNREPQTADDCEIILKELQLDGLIPVVSASITPQQVSTPIPVTSTGRHSILSVLQETRQEIVEERTRCLGRFTEWNSNLDYARRNLQRAQDEERSAIYADEEVKAATRQLIEYINSRTDETQMLREKLERQQTEQLQTYRARIAAAEITRQRLRELSEAETQFAVAQQNLKVNDQRILDIDAQIRGVRGF